MTRILYRLRLNSEAQPFDVVSLEYILPFVGIVLEARGVDAPDEEAADEQVTLALELIALHGNLCPSDPGPMRRR